MGSLLPRNGRAQEKNDDAVPRIVLTSARATPTIPQHRWNSNALSIANRMMRLKEQLSIEIGNNCIQIQHVNLSKDSSTQRQILEDFTTNASGTHDQQHCKALSITSRPKVDSKLDNHAFDDVGGSDKGRDMTSGDHPPLVFHLEMYGLQVPLSFSSNGATRQHKSDHDSGRFLNNLYSPFDNGPTQPWFCFAVRGQTISPFHDQKPNLLRGHRQTHKCSVNSTS
jgi:hypothetical protein